jgi:hypothetical protein
MYPFPESLQAASPAEGHALASQLAELALAAHRRPDRDMATHLSTRRPPSVELLAAIYFQTVAVANEGWRR